MRIGVVICTHNPKVPLLRRVLAGLHSQTLPVSEWDLCIVDNASTKSWHDDVSIGWHPRAAIVREDKLGLTHARIRGFAETDAELITLVDDDNILAENYLDVARRLAEVYPYIGVLGGSIEGEYPTELPSWMTQFEYDLLGVRPTAQDYWSNIPWLWQTTPIGAGMVIRKCVADAYRQALKNDGLRAALDRRGRSLVSGGDSDIAATACELNLGTGRFADLKVTHVISEDRLNETHLSALAESIGFSQALLERIHQKQAPASVGRLYGLLQRTLDRYQTLRLVAPRRRIRNALAKGRKRGEGFDLTAVGLHSQ